MKKLIFALVLLFSVKAFAILPPFYHGLREINAIIEDPILHEKLGSGELIEEIKRVEGGYRVTTFHYTLFVEVEYVPTEVIGPGKFLLHFSEPVRING